MNMAGIVQPKTPQEADEIFRRRFPTTAANEAIELPKPGGGEGGLLPETHADKAKRVDAESRRATAAVALKDISLDIKAKQKAAAVDAPPPAVGAVEQSIQNVIDSIDAPGVVEVLTQLGALVFGAGTTTAGITNAAMAEQAASTIEKEMAGFSAEDKETAIAAFKKSGKLKLLEDARKGLAPSFIHRITGTTEDITRARAAIDRMIYAMQGN